MILEKIHVTAVDNELYLIASTGNGSLELCHIKSGYNKPVDYTVYPGAILPELPEGELYNLTMIGINWGYRFAFKVTLFFDDNSQAEYEDTGEPQIGCVWSEMVPNISVRHP
ncbi:hypothetical protein HAP94_03225 [Acidithiobacillus ferrivorans]|nr:hypothetical protein [Acidithiobacillus ferrivorans]